METGDTWVSPLFILDLLKKQYNIYVQLFLLYCKYYPLQMNETHFLNFKDLKKFEKGYEIELLNTMHKDITTLM